MSGLSSPRDVAFGPDGGLYVAEAGRGGDGPSLFIGAGEGFLGATGGVSRLLGGVQERIVSGLPSIATQGELVEAHGLHDIEFNAAGEAFAVIGGVGPSAATRSTLGEAGQLLGHLVRLPINGGVLESIADLSTFEVANDPNSDGPDSNPYGLEITPSGDFLVADAGANALLRVTAAGNVTVRQTFTNQPNPLPFGPPVYDAVPTSVALAPNGDAYVGQLTGFPFAHGAANIFRLPSPAGEAIAAFSGFTNVVDIAFGPDSRLYVLEISTEGLVSQNHPEKGALHRIDLLTGQRTTILDVGLVLPGGITVGSDGTLYVSNGASSPDAGQVLRLKLVPEPSCVALLLVGLVGLAGHRGRRCLR